MIWKPMFSEFSVFSALLFFTAYTLICCMICKKIGWRTLRTFGIGIGLLILRCLLPFEIPGVELIKVSGWYADLWQWLNPYFAESIKPITVLIMLWVLGSFICLFRLACRLYRQYKLIQQNTVTSHPRLENIYHTVLWEMSCSSVGHICVDEDFSTPMMAGFLKPHILFPKEMADLPEDKLRFIFQHEITHFKKRDLWIKLIVELLCCALWWNPVVYLLRICVSQLLEMRCDSFVCEELDPHQQLAYSQTLLNSFRKTVHRPIYVTAEYLGYPSKDRLKQRFTQILYAPAQPRNTALSMLIIVLSLLAFIGSYCVIIQPTSKPEGADSIYEIYDTSFGNAFILRYPDGSLVVYIDSQMYASISEDQLSTEPFASMLIIEANPTTEEE